MQSISRATIKGLPAFLLPLQYAYNAEQLKELEKKAYRGDEQAALDLYARAALVYDDRDEKLHWLTVGVLNGSPVALMNYSIFLKDAKLDENLYRLRKNFILFAWDRFSGKWSAEIKQEVREHYRDQNITFK